MALDGAQFICIGTEDDAGSPASGQPDVCVEGRVVEAKGRKFTVGYYMNSDYVLDDKRAKGVHCEIQCDAFGRVTIHNFSEDYPVIVNDQIISIKRPLLHGSRIRILDKEFLWKFPKSSASSSGSEDEDLSRAQTSPPQKSAAEQPPTSCPHLKPHRSVTKRFTIHNFAYCIQSYEEGNTSAETSHTVNTTAELGDEMQTPEVAEANTAQTSENSSGHTTSTTAEITTKLATVGESKSTSVERCVTPGAVATDSHVIDTLETPKMNMINCTKNKENKSTEKKLQLLSLCHQSDVVITSFSPRETGVRIGKSFTAVLKPAIATPKSVYSTPKSVLSEYNDDGSRDFIDFSTPATSKKTLATRVATNSSMHLIDLTTPVKLRPASPQPKTALKSVSKQLPGLAEEKPSTSQKADTTTATLLEEGIKPLPASPLTSNDGYGKKIDLPTPSSAGSVISVDGSTDISSVIELSGEDSTPGSSTVTQTVPTTPRQASSVRKATTPMRTPQSLMKRAILTSAKKQASAARLASNAITPARKVAVSKNARVGAGTSSSPVTPKSSSASTKVALALKQRQSLSATSRNSLVAQKLKLENSPRDSLSTMEARAISTSTPLQPRALATSSSVAAKLRNISPLHGVRMTIGNITLPSHISKSRKSIMLAGRRTPPSLGAQLVAKARKSLCATTSMSNARSRSLVAAAVSASTLKSSATSEVLGVATTVDQESCKKLEQPAESTEAQSNLDSDELSRTFIVDDSFAEEASTAVLGEIVEKSFEKNVKGHKDITFSPAKIPRPAAPELICTFASENPSKVVDPLTETPIDVAEVQAASPVMDQAPTDGIRSVELFDDRVGNHPSVIAENFAESVELVTSEPKCDENVGSTVEELLESAPLMHATNAVDEQALANNIERDITTATEESSKAKEAEAMPCDSNTADDKELGHTKAEIDKKPILLETAPDTNNISSTTHTVSAECMEDSALFENEAEVGLETVVDTVEEVAHTGCLSTVAFEAEPVKVQDETEEEILNDTVTVTQTVSEESATMTAIEAVLDQDNDDKNESVAPIAREESASATSILEAAPDKDHKMKNKSVAPTASDESVTTTEIVEAVSDQDHNEKNESVAPIINDESATTAAIVEAVLDQDHNDKNESVAPIAREESASVTAILEAAPDKDHKMKNKSVAPTASDESVTTTEIVEAASDQDHNVKNESVAPIINDESATTTAIDEAVLDQDHNVKNESVTPIVSDESASVTATEVVSDQDRNLKIESGTPTASDESATVIAIDESVLDQDHNVKNESVAPIVSDESASVTATEVVSDQDRNVKMESGTPTASDESATTTAIDESVLDQDHNVKNESVAPIVSDESATVIAIDESVLDQDHNVKNESVAPIVSDESASVTATEAVSDQDRNVKNGSGTPTASDESATTTAIVEAVLDQDHNVKNESVAPTTSDESATPTALKVASEQDHDVKNDSEPANVIVPVTLTDAGEIDAIVATGESEETAMLLEEIEYVLNKSDELQQKQIEKSSPDQPSEQSNNTLSNKLDGISYNELGMEIVDITKDINKPESLDQEKMGHTVRTEGTIEEILATEELVTKVTIVSNSKAEEAILLDKENVTKSLIQTTENIDKMFASRSTGKPLVVQSLETAVETPPNTTENIESIITANEEATEKRTSPSSQTTTTTTVQLHMPPSPPSPNLCGVREMLKTPSRVGSKSPELIGLRHLVRTPKARKRYLVDSDDVDSFEALRTLLKTPHHSKKRDSVATSTQHAEPATTFTPRRSTRRRASASAEITPTYAVGTPRRSTRRRASESAEPLSATVGTFTPKRITARRPSLSLDDDAALTPRTRGTHARRLATFAENVEDMDAIAEEASKEVTEEVTLRTHADVELLPNDVLEENKSKTDVESTTNKLQAKFEKEIVASVSKIIDENICEEVQHVQRVVDEKAAPVEQEIVMQSDDVDRFDKKTANVANIKMLSVKNVEIQKVEDVVNAANRDVNDDNQNEPPQQAQQELANSRAEVLDKSDYDYGKEVVAAKEFDVKPATTTLATAQTIPVNTDRMDAQTSKCRKVVMFEEHSPKTPVMVGVREMLRTPKVVTATPKLLGVRDLVRTPKSSTRPNGDDEELEGLAELVKTPKADVRGGPEEEPPSTSAEARLAYLGMRERLKTPKYCSTPLLKGVREMMQTPKNCSSPQLDGIKQLMDTSIRSADNADAEQPLKQEVVVTDLDETVTEGLDKFFKTPRAKDVMIPGLPPSAVIEQNSESVGLMAATEYDLNATPGSAAGLEDIFKTPVSTRFAERIIDSCAMDSKITQEKGTTQEVVGSVATAKGENSGPVSKNLSCEEAFDELIGQATQFDKTPTHKVYSRKSCTNSAQPSPFSASDVISDIPRTDIQEWVDSLEAEEPAGVDSDYADVTERDVEEQEISLTTSMLEHNASRDPIADSSRQQSTDTKAETLMSVSFSSSALDPLLGSACKGEDEMGPLQTVEEEEDSVRATTPVESDISGINLLDQTNESIFSEPLLVSDSDSVDENINDEKKWEQEIRGTDIEKEMQTGVDKITPEREDDKAKEKDKESEEEKAAENVEGTAPDGDDSDKKNNLPIMLTDSDADSSVIEETPVKRNIVAAVKRQIKMPKDKTRTNSYESFNEKVVDESGTGVEKAYRDEVENDPKQDIEAEFDNFQENVVVLFPRSSTPDQRKARAKLSRKTLGAEEDLQLTLDLNLEKAELEKARLIEECARQAANKAESVICLDDDGDEQGAEEKMDVDQESTVHEEIANVEQVKATDKEDNIICLNENEGVNDEQAVATEDEVAVEAELVFASNNADSNLTHMADNADPMKTECEPLLSEITQVAEPLNEHKTDDKAAEEHDVDQESSIVGQEKENNEVPSGIDRAPTEEIITPPEVTIQIIEDVSKENVVADTKISPSKRGKLPVGNVKVDSSEYVVEVTDQLEGNTSGSVEAREKLATADISIMPDETESTICSNTVENLTENESQVNQRTADSLNTAASETVECTTEISIITNETRPTSSASAAESSGDLAVNQSLRNQSKVDLAKTAVPESIAEDKGEPAGGHNAEKESTDKKILETGLTEAAPKRRGRKGSRSKQQGAPHDEQPAVAATHETDRLSPAIEKPLKEDKATEKLNEGLEEATHNNAQIFISTDYVIKIESVPEKGAKVEKTISQESKDELKMPVDDTNAGDLGELKSVEGTEPITKQVNTHSNSSPVTECDAERSESIATEPTVAAETDSVAPPAEVDETVIVAEEIKVRKRPRKGSQSSQSFTQENRAAPNRRGGRRKAVTPIEVIADSSTSSEHTEISTTGSDLPKRRRGNKKVETLLEEVGEDEAVIEQVEVPDNKAHHPEVVVEEISADVAPIVHPIVEICDRGNVTEDHTRIDENKATTETLVEKELSQKRTRRRVAIAEANQSSSFAGSNEASTSRRRRGRKNTEESNGGRALEVQQSEIVESATNKDVSVTKDIAQDDEIVDVTLDTATGIISSANEEQSVRENEREVALPAKDENPEQPTTPEATKRQFRGRRKRQLSVTRVKENKTEVRPIVKEATSAEQEKDTMNEPSESKTNAKTVGGRAGTAREKHEVNVAEKETADSHEELIESISKPVEESTQENSPKEEDARKLAPKRRGGRKAKDPDVVELSAPRRRGGTRRMHEELPECQQGPVSEHDSTPTAVRPAKVQEDPRRNQEELESVLQDAPKGDVTEEDRDHEAGRPGQKRRGNAVARRTARGKAKKKEDNADESKPLEESLQHLTIQPLESAAHVIEMVEDSKDGTDIKQMENKCEVSSLQESHVDHNDVIKEIVDRKAVEKPKGRKGRRDSHEEEAQAENLEQEAEVKSIRRKRKESYIEPNETEKADEKIETKVARGRKRRESIAEPHTADLVHSDEPPHKRGAVVAPLQMDTETKPDSPENAKVAPRHTRKASALDSSHHSAHESDISTGTPRRMRSRNVPRRAATAQDHNYDESSDTEAQAEFKRRLERQVQATTAKDMSMTEKPTTSRGRTRKPTAIVQQYLEEERAKADTPKRRLLLSSRNETPTSETRHMPARRGRKASTIDVDALGTPQSIKRGRGKVAAVAAAASQATEVSEESRTEVEHASEQDETQSSHTEEKEVVPIVPSRSQARRRGKAVHEHQVAVEVAEGEPHEAAVTDEVVPVQSAKRGRTRGRARTESVDTATEVATVTKTTEEKPQSSTRGRGTRVRKAKPIDPPIVDKVDVQLEAEQQDVRRMASASTVAGSMNEEDLLSVGIVVGSDTQMEAKSVNADEEDEHEPLATVTAKATKRKAAVRKVASNTDPPAPKRGRRKAAAADVAHASDEADSNMTSRSATGGRGRKVVRFEPADGAVAAAAATVDPEVVVDAVVTVEPTEAAAAPLKRATRTRRK